MLFDPIYAIQRRTIARKMHAQVNKLYLHDKQHPYIKTLNDLCPQYMYRIQHTYKRLQHAVDTKTLADELLDDVTFELATNPCAQAKVLYTELLDFRHLYTKRARNEGTQEEYAITLRNDVERLLLHIPDVAPESESAATQMEDIQDFVMWYKEACDYSLYDIIHYTERQYLQKIMHSFKNSVYPKAPRMLDYAMNIDAVVYSSLRLLQADPLIDDAGIIFWCCMYLRYCAPGFLDYTSVQEDTYTKTLYVLNILHNEWQYLQQKHQ